MKKIEFRPLPEEGGSPIENELARLCNDEFDNDFANALMKHIAEQYPLLAVDAPCSGPPEIEAQIRRAKEYRPLTYLACPYSSPMDFVREQRFEAVNKATAWLIDTHDLNVFSPITHSHPLHELGLCGTWEFWKRIDTEYLNCSNRVIVLAIDGWKESVGVQAEIKYAKENEIPVSYLVPSVIGCACKEDGCENTLYKFVNEKNI